jgi:Spy/CpxP family protein refolding chaperone
MKKLATTLGILFLVGVLAAPVLAHRGGWGGWSRGFDNCGQGSEPYGNLSESQNAELDKLEQKFFNDTAKLRDENWAKSEELSTLLNSAEPDVKKVRTLQKEITGLRAEMDRQRIDFELEARKITPNSGYGRGHSRGYGRHMMGYGPGHSRGYGRHMMGYGPGHSRGYGRHMMGSGGGYGHGPRHWN